jgi:hypothetical protein
MIPIRANIESKAHPKIDRLACMIGIKFTIWVLNDIVFAALYVTA